MEDNTLTGVTTRRNPRGLLQCGFTLLSLTFNLIFAGAVVTGGWMAYRNLQVQWKVGNAERMMDQYAASTMQELTNILSWSWGGEPITGGQYTRWKFVVDDIIEEHGLMQRWRYNRASGVGYHYITLSSEALRGILISNQQPKWVKDGRTSQYLWTGTRPGIYETHVFDRRDRMTVEGLSIDWNLFPYYPAGGSGAEQDLLNRRCVAKIRLVVHYQYSAPYGSGLYSGSYVRERVYETQVMMRNWDVESNFYRDIILGLNNGNSSG